MVDMVQIFRLSLASQPNVGPPVRGDGHPRVTAQALDTGGRWEDRTHRLAATAQEEEPHTIRGATRQTHTGLLATRTRRPATAVPLLMQHRPSPLLEAPRGMDRRPMAGSPPHRPTAGSPPHRDMAVRHTVVSHQEAVDTETPPATEPRERAASAIPPLGAAAMGHMEVDRRGAAMEEPMGEEGDLPRVDMLGDPMVQLHSLPITMLRVMVPQGAAMGLTGVGVPHQQGPAMGEPTAEEGDLPRAAMQAQPLVYMARLYLQMPSLCRIKRVSLT